MRGQIIKNLLAASLEEQLKKKHIDSITVNDIIADVGVSRTTFYRHFEDKFALVHWVYGQYMDELTQRHKTAADFRQLISELLHFFQEKRSFFMKILTYSGQNTFYNYFFNRTTEYLTTQIMKTMTDKELTLSDQLMIRYHCGGILKVIYDWMERNCPETPEKIAEILSEMASGKHRMYSNPFFQNIYKPKPPKR